MTIVTKWIPSAHHSSRKGTVVDLCVLHFTAGNGDEIGLGRFFGMPSRGAASHYGVGRPGGVAQYVSETRAAWHAGDGLCPEDFGDASLKHRVRWVDNVNRRSIGIEICNRGFPPSRKGRARVEARHPNPLVKSTSWEAYPPAQFDAVATLIVEIAGRHPGIVITGHEDVTNYVTTGNDKDRDGLIERGELGGSKLDPGPAFDWAEMQRRTGLRRLRFDYERQVFVLVAM